ncbi:glycine--tRNA ligase, partial [Patescibacteria group bacterium]|nr:glycine--tRNA ligase [Patescibacteria group bacterium]
EFEQMEIEYFIHEENWEKDFEEWKKAMEDYIVNLGVKRENLSWRRHEDNELSHYSKRTEDLEFKFPFGLRELYGLAYRTDFDLKTHAKHSGQELSYKDANTNESFVPHVIEPSMGVERTFLAILVDAYEEEDLGEKGTRTVLRLNPKIAPYKAAVFPLVANKEEIVGKAKEIFNMLILSFPVAFDDRGNIGKRYFSQDEIGTPWCVTVDYQTLEDDTVTVRDRDTTNQERIPIDKLVERFQNNLK